MTKEVCQEKLDKLLMSTDLKIFKTSFDISIYEIITDYDSQILKNYINDLQMPKEENVHSTFYLEKNILFNSSLNNFKNFISKIF